MLTSYAHKPIPCQSPGPGSWEQQTLGWPVLLPVAPLPLLTAAPSFSLCPNLELPRPGPQTPCFPSAPTPWAISSRLVAFNSTTPRPLEHTASTHTTRPPNTSWTPGAWMSEQHRRRDRPAQTPSHPPPLFLPTADPTTPQPIDTAKPFSGDGVLTTAGPRAENKSNPG